MEDSGKRVKQKPPPILRLAIPLFPFHFLFAGIPFSLMKNLFLFGSLLILSLSFVSGLETFYLAQGRQDLAATSVGDLAIFAGGVSSLVD